MTYAEHKAACIDAGRCIQRGCTNAHADGSDLCVPHWTAHKFRNRRYINTKRAQLGLPFVHNAPR